MGALAPLSSTNIICLLIGSHGLCVEPNAPVVSWVGNTILSASNLTGNLPLVSTITADMAKKKQKAPPTQKKVTVYLPTDLLERALASTDGNITETIRKGLELMAASQAYDSLRKLRGRVSLSLDITKLREDRR
jgi:hypothetical protein